MVLIGIENRWNSREGVVNIIYYNIYIKKKKSNGKLWRLLKLNEFGDIFIK